ncbi:CheR family methyltransferase [Candidatus Entotheonella palauensis]|uniref:CheR family methyltransferase n=1 Tax=Candidatus Entotheonella palauensis TaxID=93172 RepID=UPI0015C4640C|nr:CheR family methyltransferase [Candidatus Entotheonella palauensis]
MIRSSLQALEALFQAMPTDTGLSFVIVQHLSPSFKSIMDELLARVTTIPIEMVAQSVVPQPDTIYLMPPGSELILANGALEPLPPESAAAISSPIDRFFASLAQSLGDHAIGIVLSGTGNDGARGIVELHEAGGLIIVQEPKSAEFDGMPLSALETGLAEWVLAPEQMAQALVTYLSTPYPGRQGPNRSRGAVASMEAITRLLWDHHGVDFTHYKTATIARRIERRVSLSEHHDIEAYAQHLADDISALNQLYRDLLIGVTRFFRDAGAFRFLERDILPLLLQDAGRARELRLWVAGCATGEEAYSLAMLLHESLRQQPAAISIQIFATDVHQGSLNIASEGFYAYEAIEHISPERLARYFIEEADGFRVVPVLRQMIVFARHDLTRDAPFTKLDFITCRNVLIYFQPEWQEQILRRLSSGLRLGGMLFLGQSESVGSLSEVLTEVERHWKVYRKDQPSGLLSEAITSSRSARHTPSRAHAMAPPRAPARQQLYNVLLEAVVPAGMLVNAQGQWEHIVGDVTPFLQSLRGPSGVHVLELVHPDLRGTLQAATLRATSELETITSHHVSFSQGSKTAWVRLRVMPLVEAPGRPPALFIMFILDSQVEERTSLSPPAPIDGDRLQLVEHELYQTKAALHTTVEELQTRTDELQMTNEELAASNEELQSSNEELQSVNEELHTVNAEYQLKNQQLAALITDTENLLRSTDIGTVFLDMQQGIRKYTPAVTSAIPLQPQDVGRPLSHLTTSLDISQDILQDLIQQVMLHHTPVTREVRATTGTWLLMRIHPFIAPGDDVEGTVVTFVDITERKQAEQDRQAYEARLRREEALRQLLESTSDAMVVVVDETGCVVHANVQAETVFGYGRYDLLEQPVERLMPKRFRQGHQAYRQTFFGAASARAMGAGLDLYGQHRDGHEFPVEINLIPIEAETGQLIAVAIRDVSERKRAELLQRQMDEMERKNHELRTQQAALDAAVAALERSNADLDTFISIASHDLKEPLRGIRNYAQMLQEDCTGQLGPNHQEDLDTLGRLARRLEQRIEDLRTYARIGRIDVDPELLDMEKIVAEVCEQLTVLLTEQQISLRLPHPLPTVRYHRAHLVTVLQNLIANAARYNDKPERWIEIGCQAQSAPRTFYVRDNGIGIATHLQDEAFVMFRRLHSEAFAGSGSGAGLAIVRRILESYGGRVWLTSQPGQGTTVFFTLGTAE